MHGLLCTHSVSLEKFLNVSETPGKHNNSSNNNQRRELAMFQCPEQFARTDVFALDSKSVVCTVISLFSHMKKQAQRG